MPLNLTTNQSSKFLLLKEWKIIPMVGLINLLLSPAQEVLIALKEKSLAESFFIRVFLNDYGVDTIVATEYDMWVDRQNGDIIAVEPGATCY